MLTLLIFREKSDHHHFIIWYLRMRVANLEKIKGQDSVLIVISRIKDILFIVFREVDGEFIVT